MHIEAWGDGGSQQPAAEAAAVLHALGGKWGLAGEPKSNRVVFSALTNLR